MAISEDYVDLSHVDVPETDEKLAQEGLIQLAKIALGPVGLSSKIAALDKLLAYTKAKPVTKLDVKSESHDEWLKSMVTANAVSKKDFE